jgi:hypothetical protein
VACDLSVAVFLDATVGGDRDKLRTALISSLSLAAHLVNAMPAHLGLVNLQYINSHSQTIQHI